MNKILVAMTDVLDVANAPRVKFGGETYALFWTDHARERAADTAPIAEARIIKAVGEIEKANKSAPGIKSQYFCIRHTIENWFAVLNVTQENHRLRVVTYRGDKVLWPKNGDITYQFEADFIRLRVWEYTM